LDPNNRHHHHLARPVRSCNAPYHD
jgi:hypothetical protein